MKGNYKRLSIFRLGEDGEWSVIDSILTPTNDTNYYITNLQPYTVNSFRVVAVNAMGASSPSKESYYMVTLREIPTGKPTITTAHNTSATTLHISWRPPHHETIHGEFIGYRISYRPRDHGDEAMKEIYIRDPSVESHNIDHLDTYTQYLVSLQVVNPEGNGPRTTVLVMTDEGEKGNINARKLSQCTNCAVLRNFLSNSLKQGIRMSVTTV
ncbi:hypothetical protein RI129_012206 [Pyrocoelia pectoralis]|uniref:Fibronectin type-III domain-containing protein n=1 Tax=Pyrocoelia pectoralis TaxID=417401 RepID=A0AAN7V496_9COLE